MLGLFYCISIAIVAMCMIFYADKKEISCTPKTAIGVTLISVLWPLSLLIWLLTCVLDTVDELGKK